MGIRQRGSSGQRKAVSSPLAAQRERDLVSRAQDKTQLCCELVLRLGSDVTLPSDSKLHDSLLCSWSIDPVTT
jgi:hypothetical protein